MANLPGAGTLISDIFLVANQRFSKAIRAVRAGKEVVLTERGLHVRARARNEILGRMNRVSGSLRCSTRIVSGDTTPSTLSDTARKRCAKQHSIDRNGHGTLIESQVGGRNVRLVHKVALYLPGSLPVIVCDCPR